MTGTILNAITVAIGSALGLTIGSRISAKIQESVITGLGLVTAFVGFSNAGRSGNIIIPLISLVSGAILGELLDLDGALGRLGGWLQRRFAAGGAAQPHPEGERGGDHESRVRFVNGFVTASLVFCIGPLTFVGSIQDGMGLAIGFQQLAIKSVLDGFASMAFAASMGAGVAFSILTILILQGGLALAGSLLGGFMSDPMINEMTAVGGLMLMGMSLILLDLKRPRMANFLPALVIAPVIVAAAAALGINLYPL
ncbi:MAG: DUF554 domain-containing protein [Anaerolineae bacterium]|nr:DUF554 domain-containing protein [Anaerolineae bacterium]NUQ04531.1 DUF554 domain-containing protein [Anaerolineae bacterium]